jgi:crotonobetainyl-CoA:carnitine CoA-transferase CaiB-like acyl-CoA transferase
VSAALDDRRDDPEAPREISTHSSLPLGEHTDEILEEAGIAAADHAALRASGITS